MKAEGLKSGVWDIHLPYPVGKHHGLWIEMKAGKNKLTENQLQFQSNLENYYSFAVCYTWLSARDVIVAYVSGERF